MADELEKLRHQIHNRNEIRQSVIFAPDPITGAILVDVELHGQAFNTRNFTQRKEKIINLSGDIQNAIMELTGLEPDEIFISEKEHQIPGMTFKYNSEEWSQSQQAAQSIEDILKTTVTLQTAPKYKNIASALRGGSQICDVSRRLLKNADALAATNELLNKFGLNQLEYVGERSFSAVCRTSVHRNLLIRLTTETEHYDGEEALQPFFSERVTPDIFLEIYRTVMTRGVERAHIRTLNQSLMSKGFFIADHSDVGLLRTTDNRPLPVAFDKTAIASIKNKLECIEEYESAVKDYAALQGRPPRDFWQGEQAAASQEEIAALRHHLQAMHIPFVADTSSHLTLSL